MRGSRSPLDHGALSPIRTVAQNGREPAALRIPEGRGRHLLVRSLPWTASLPSAYQLGLFVGHGNAILNVRVLLPPRRGFSQCRAPSRLALVGWLENLVHEESILDRRNVGLAVGSGLRAGELTLQFLWSAGRRTARRHRARDGRQRRDAHDVTQTHRPADADAAWSRENASSPPSQDVAPGLSPFDWRRPHTLKLLTERCCGR